MNVSGKLPEASSVSSSQCTIQIHWLSLLLLMVRLGLGWVSIPLCQRVFSFTLRLAGVVCFISLLVIKISGSVTLQVIRIKFLRDL